MTPAGAAVVGLDAAGDQRVQDAEMREGRYVAYDTSVTTARAVELTRDEYLALLPSSRRVMSVIAGLMAAGAAADACRRRADGGRAAPRGHRLRRVVAVTETVILDRGVPFAGSEPLNPA